MFDLAWSEIALIGVVALIVIGPKDLPGAIRGVASMLGKARRMAGEFQTHVDEMVREAKLDEVKREIDQFKTNVQSEVSRAAQMDEFKRDVVDPIQATARDLERPFDPPPPPPPAAPAADTASDATDAAVEPAPVAASPEALPAPAAEPDALAESSTPIPSPAPSPIPAAPGAARV